MDLSLVAKEFLVVVNSVFDYTCKSFTYNHSKYNIGKPNND